jgi:hypothetical protein
MGIPFCGAKYRREGYGMSIEISLLCLASIIPALHSRLNRYHPTFLNITGSLTPA